MAEMNDLTDFKRIDDKIIQAYHAIGYTSKLNSPKSAALNLGIYRDKTGYHTGRFCGTTWLKDKHRGIIKDADGKPQTITVNPRFDLSLDTMVQKIAQDEEFYDYLCNDLDEGERLFTFFFQEDMIDAQKDEFGANRLIAVLSFIHELYRVTGRSLMKKIVRLEDNLVGKVKGKILFNKQISKNATRGHDEKIYCGYVQKSEDIYENQVLKYALQQAEDYLSKGSAKIGNALVESEIKACKLRLNRVADLDEVDADALETMQVPAMYASYEELFRLAKVVIAEVALNSSIENCSEKIIPYAVNMPLLFECFIRTLIKEEIARKRNTTNAQYEMLKFVPDKSGEYDEGEYGIRTIGGKHYISGKLVPDIVLVRKNGQEPEQNMVLDVKYKGMEWSAKGDNALLNYNLGQREDRLQMLAYDELYQPISCGHVFPHTNAKNFLYVKSSIGCGSPMPSPEIPYFMFSITLEKDDKGRPKGYKTNVLSPDTNFSCTHYGGNDAAK